jgi:hypothetical protein
MPPDRNQTPKTRTQAPITPETLGQWGCGSTVAGAPPTAHPPISDRPAAVTGAGAKQADIYVQVLRRYLSTPAENMAYLCPAGSARRRLARDRHDWVDGDRLTSSVNDKDRVPGSRLLASYQDVGRGT